VKEEACSFDEMPEMVKAFREYEVYKAKDSGYELVKEGVVVGSFSDARVEKNRVVFLLSHGTLLEVSEKGRREILTPEKAELCGLIASDGGNHFYWRFNRKTGTYHPVYRTSLDSKDKELIDRFDSLFKEVYNAAPHHYPQRDGKMRTMASNKGIFYDLQDVGAKTGPFKFHVPIEHLDEEGLRAYLRGFFSGDGNVSRQGAGRIAIRIYSSCGECLGEVRQAFIDLGFHPHEIHRRVKPRWNPEHSFSIPAREHIRFIEEIGSKNPEHIRKFQEMRRVKSR